MSDNEFNNFDNTLDPASLFIFGLNNFEQNDEDTDTTDENESSESEDDYNEENDADDETSTDVSTVDYDFLDLCVQNKLDDVKLNYSEYLHRNITDIHNNTPLMIAVENNYFEMAYFFLEMGLDTFRKNFDGNNSLMIACLHNFTDMISLLLTYNIRKISINNDGNNALHLVCIKGNLIMLKSMVEEYHFNITGKNNDGYNCLMLATMYKHYSCVEYLLNQNSINIEEKNDIEQTCLNMACCDGNEEISQLLLNNLADYNTIDIYGNNCIISAVVNNKINLIINILCNYNVDIEHQNNEGETALWIACKNNNYEIAVYLIEKMYANILVKNKNNNDILMYMLMGNTYDNKLFEYLLERSLINGNYNINHKNKIGYTILMISTEKGYLDIVKKLIENRANYNLKNSEGTCCLTIAVTEGHLNILKFFFKKYVTVYSKDILNTTDLDGNTLLNLACKYDYYEIAEFFVKKKCKLDIKSKGYSGGYAPLHWAVKNNNFQIVRLLIENKANINLTTNNSESPIYLASKYGYKTIFRYLINKGSDCIEYENNFILTNEIKHDRDDNVKLLLSKGYSADSIILIGENEDTFNNIPILSNYVINENIEMVQYCLEQGAYVNALDDSEDTPLIHACVSKNIDIIDILLLFGANINSSNIYGNTPIDIVLNSNNKNMISYFIKNNKITIDDKGFRNRTILFNFCYNNATSIENLDFLDFLFEMKADFNCRNNDNITPLLYLCKNYSSTNEMIIKLLECGADPNLLDNDGSNAIHHCVFHTRNEIVKLITDQYNGHIHVGNNKQNTAIILAASEDNYDLVKYFIDKGVNINCQNIYGNTPLIISADHDDYDTCKLLIDNHANINLARHTDGNTAYNVTDDQHILHLMGFKTNKELLAENNYEEFCRKNKINFSLDSSLYSPTEICSICYIPFDDIENSKDRKCKLECDHYFCANCILNWYYKSNIDQKNCSLCRSMIKNIVLL